MIDVLNKVVEGKAQEPQERNFEPLPEADYNVRVSEMKQWEPMTKDVWVNRRDGENKIMKDTNGKIIKELHKNLTFYNLDVTLEILDGEHKGRKIWTSLTTHPNAEFITQGFLYAVNENKMTYGDIPTHCVDKQLVVTTFNEKYKKKVTDPDTGLENEIEKLSTRVKYFARPSTIIEPAGDVQV